MKRHIFTLILCLIILLNIIVLNNKKELKQEELINYDYIFNLNKIIIVGDSRMELINDKKESLSIPNNVIFIAQSGVLISWLYEVGLPKLYETIKKEEKYKYHVIFNLGVNDINYVEDIKSLATQYYKTYKSITQYNKEISFYFLSVNPIDENRIYTYFSPKNNRTNRKIEMFNNYFINFIKKDKLTNVKYCDSYNNLEFYLPDGLHYDTNTDKKIIKYILEKCIEIN